MTKDRPLEGTFAGTPFARLLFDLWSGERSGGLRIEAQSGKRTLYFQTGDVVVERKGLSEKDFLEALAKKGVLTAAQVRQCQLRAKEEKISRLRALSESGDLAALPLWNLLESYYARRLFALFDLDDGGWAFEPGESLSVRDRLGALPSQALILQGTRQMRNSGLIDKFLPEDGEPIQVCAPARLHEVAWEPHERYALQVLGSVPDLKTFHAVCEIGRKEARKTLFAFLCLGVLSPAEGKPKSRPAAEPAAPAPERAFEALDEKCAYLYKYVTKEIGPLGRTLLSRALEEIKPGLGPMFQKLTLLPDGRIEADTAVSHNAGHLPGELTGALLKGYEEILLAEILAVKKALGARHETALIKALERIGCL